jgi:hypothetical protein
MFANGTIPMIKGEDERLYINLIDLTRHLLLTAVAMEKEVAITTDPLVQATGNGIVTALYMLVRELSEAGLFESTVSASVSNIDNVIDLFGE